MSTHTDQPLDAIVIGAGFAGLYMLHRLRDRLGMRVLGVERAQDVGGTWYWNRYPGARCDSESDVYCYSFDRALHDEWNWSSRYPEQAEILRYLGHVADRFDLRRSIRFGTTVTAAHHDARSNLWHVRTSGGVELRARYLICGVGCLSSAQAPAIPGRERFRGECYHTGEWPHTPVDFRGKRVGVIGTGSSGVQSIPVIAQQAEQLFVFQRSPNFSLPARHVTLDDARRAEMKARYDDTWQRAKSSPAGYALPLPQRKAMETEADERRAALEEGWEQGGFHLMFSTFSDLMSDRRANDIVAEFLRERIRATVRDPDVAECLVPVDHPFGTKRALIDTRYFETFNRDNVTLVDIRHDPVVAITADGIRTRHATYPLDMIVFATGFDAITGPYLRMDIRGRDGLRLCDKWAAGPKTWLGLMLHGFPNLFTITGPGSPSVLGNVPVAIEQHVEWISDLLERQRAAGIDCIEPEASAEDEWVRHVADYAAKTLYPLADSWYMGANIPSKPRVFQAYIGGYHRYRRTCDEIAADGYRGLRLTRHRQ